MPKNIVVIYRLECDHLVYGAPNNTKRWCPYDNEAIRTVDIETKEWHIRCHGCTYARWAGMSEPHAREIKNRHETAHAGHRVLCEAIENPTAIKVRNAMIRNQVFPRRLACLRID